MTTYYVHGMDIKDFRRINEEEWKDYNEQGYDIFWCLQDFEDGRRIKENIRELKYIVCDFDNISFGDLFDKFEGNPRPTFIIGTRSGYHCYFRLSRGVKATRGLADAYREFVGEYLIPLGADPNAKDICRVLRVPHSRYWQDSKGNRYEDKEIYCEVVYDDGPDWEWEQLKRLFRGSHDSKTWGRMAGETRRAGGVLGQVLREVSETRSPFWVRANEIPVSEGLLALSGSTFVKGERYTLKQEGKIKRIYINSQPSNAWVDEKGRIGSLHQNGGVPVAGTIVNWLNFPDYGHDMKAIAKIMKEVFNVAE